MLHPLIDNAGLEVWVDTKIQPGKWQPQIDAAMKQSRIALFFVSSHFLASELITLDPASRACALRGGTAGPNFVVPCWTIVCGNTRRSRLTSGTTSTSRSR